MLHNINVNNGRQNIASFTSPTKRTTKSIDDAWEFAGVFIGVLPKFPKLETSVFRIAGQRFIHWMRVIRSLNNLCLNCNHCKHYFAVILNSRQHGEKNNFEQFVYKLVISWNLLTSVLTPYGKKNSSFAEWNESSDASEAKDCSES